MPVHTVRRSSSPFSERRARFEGGGRYRRSCRTRRVASSPGPGPVGVASLLWKGTKRPSRRSDGRGEAHELSIGGLLGAVPGRLERLQRCPRSRRVGGHDSDEAGPRGRRDIGDCIARGGARARRGGAERRWAEHRPWSIPGRVRSDGKRRRPDTTASPPCASAVLPAVRHRPGGVNATSASTRSTRRTPSRRSAKAIWRIRPGLPAMPSARVTSAAFRPSRSAAASQESRERPPRRPAPRDPRPASSGCRRCRHRTGRRPCRP